MVAGQLFIAASKVSGDSGQQMLLIRESELREPGCDFIGALATQRPCLLPLVGHMQIAIPALGKPKAEVSRGSRAHAFSWCWIRWCNRDLEVGQDGVVSICLRC